jgi:hypothetical protein
LSDITLNGAVLMGVISSLSAVIVFLYRQSQVQHEREITRLTDLYNDRIADLKEVALSLGNAAEKSVDVLRQEKGRR